MDGLSPVTPPEEVIWPDLPIIDPHHHLWDRRDAYADLPADAHPFSLTMQRASRYMLDDFLADMASGDVTPVSHPVVTRVRR